MIWSKLSRTARALRAESVRERVEIHFTRYGSGVSHMMTRGWLTWDGAELLTCSTIHWWRERQALTRELEARELEARDRRLTPAELERRVDDALAARDIYSRGEFYDALEAYVALPIADALRSPDPLIRAVACFDRRVGKRRLLDMSLEGERSAFVRRCHQLRLAAEGIGASAQ